MSPRPLRGDPKPARLAWVVAACCLFLAASPGIPCDDAVLLLVTGTRPTDRFCRQLLDMSHSLRDMAGDLTGYNDVAAGRKLDQVLKSWIQFDTGMIQNPPQAVREDPDGQGKIKRIADLLGLLKGLFDRKDFEGAHSLLEPVVIQMSALSSLVLRQKSLQDFLGAEFRLATLKPGFQGLSREGAFAALGSFTREVEAWRVKLPPESKPAFEELLSSAGEFRGLLENPGPIRVPQMAAGYSALLKKFGALKKDLLGRNWFDEKR